MAEMLVTPWDVEGVIDYKKLIKEFGVSPLTDTLQKRIKKHAREIPFQMRRNIFFAHRDLSWALDEYEKGNKFFLYTGCGPSGPLHLGHLSTWIFTKWLQDTFDVDLWFQFTDDEKFLFKKKSFEEIQEWTKENMLDVIALGFNPKKTHFLVDTWHANIMYPEAIKIAKKITFSTIKSAFGFTNERNLGEIFYTSMQAVPAILPSAIAKRNIPCIIPLGIDQDTHFRVARDVYPKLGFHKPAILHGMFMPPLTGNQGKMSSSSENHAILTTDDPKTVTRKINKYAFSGGGETIEEHKKNGGNPNIDVCYQYLNMMFEPSDEKLKKIYDDYRSGKLLTGDLKKITIEKINAFLKAHQAARKQAKSKIDDYLYK